MAEAIGVAGSIVGIASAGIAVVSALTKFSISIRGSNEKINSLAGRVSLTVSILEDIASHVKDHASGFKTEQFKATWSSVLYACKDSYARIDRAITKARGRSSARGSEEWKVSMWGKLVWALGGEAEMRDLEASLERCCQQVMMMQQTVQMTVLTLIAQRQQLSANEADERKELMGKLEWLLSSLSANGILPGWNSKEKPVIVVHDDRYEHDTQAIEVNLSENAAPSPVRDGKLGDRGGNFLGEEPGAPTGGTESLATFALNLFSRPGSQRPVSHRPGNTVSLKAPQKSSRQETPDPILESQTEPFIEAFYIIPRSLPRHQERGVYGLAKPTSDDYMVVCVDVRGDYYKDKNLRTAVRAAKKMEDHSTIERFPRRVRETAKWLTSHRSEHTSGVIWNLACGIELEYADDSLRSRFSSSSKAGFLVVLRGICTQDAMKSRSWLRSTPAHDSPAITNRPTHDEDDTKRGELTRRIHSRSREKSLAPDLSDIHNEWQRTLSNRERDTFVTNPYERTSQIAPLGGGLGERIQAAPYISGSPNIRGPRDIMRDRQAREQKRREDADRQELEAIKTRREARSMDAERRDSSRIAIAAGAAGHVVKGHNKQPEADIIQYENVNAQTGAPLQKSFKERAIKGQGQVPPSPQHSIHSFLSEAASNEQLKMGASGIPDVYDPIPEVGYGDDSDEVSEAGTNPSIIEGPTGGSQTRSRGHWPRDAARVEVPSVEYLPDESLHGIGRGGRAVGGGEAGSRKSDPDPLLITPSRSSSYGGWTNRGSFHEGPISNHVSDLPHVNPHSLVFDPVLESYKEGEIDTEAESFGLDHRSVRPGYANVEHWMELNRGNSPTIRVKSCAFDDSDIVPSARTLGNEREKHKEVYVSQQQAEAMVMDFLATFADIGRTSH